MNKIVSVLKKYMYVISVLIGVSIILGVSYSNFLVSSNNHKAAEMYISSLKYSIEIDGVIKNTLSVPSGVTVVDVNLVNLNSIDTYYKLLYLKNLNLKVEYYGTTKDTDEVVTTYNKSIDSITSDGINSIKLKITNNSSSSQTLDLSVKGGYITNTVSDITTPSTYSEITLIDESANTYFCNKSDVLTQGLKYVNGQYTYVYKQEGRYASSGLEWKNISNNGWGVQLTDKTSTDAVTSKACTFINNMPIISMSYMFYESKATMLDLSNFNTNNVENMDSMFSYSKAKILDLSSFDVSNVESMNYMFRGAEATIGYAKDEESASKFNASSNKPDSLVFVVKTIGNVIKAEKPSGFENTVRGGLYRFVGSSNNYICLGTCSDSTRYRVIGITDNSSLNTDLGLKENQVKIIRDKYYSSNRASSTGDWEKYEINTYLNQTEINNIIPSGWDSKITSQKWYKYNVSNNNASTADDIITAESKSVTSTNTKLGLMSLADYYYSETSGGTKSCYNSACTNTWLYDSSIEQETMSYYGAMDTGVETKYFWYIPYNGKALYSSLFATRPPDGTIYNTIKPVMYLDANVLVKGNGSGTLDDPFILKAN